MLQLAEGFHQLEDGTIVRRITRVEGMLRRQQTVADEKWREKERAKGHYVPTRRLRKDRLDVVEQAIIKLFEGGLPTVFEPEGACRHGIRSSLCLQGWSWSDADHCAAQIVATALRKLGATRPTWQQGQPEWTQDGQAPVERTRCAVCGNPMETSHHTTPRIYCSPLCQQAAYRERARATLEKRSRDEWRAAVAAEKARHHQQREMDCEHCGKSFIRLLRKPTQRFCSNACGSAASALAKRIPDQACLHCGTMYRPKREQTKYCSLACSGAAQSAAMRRPPKACECCGSEFHPVIESRKFCSIECRNKGAKKLADHPCRQCDKMFSPRMSKGKVSEYCSKECFGASCRKPRPELTCETCRTIFFGDYAADVRRFCSPRCAQIANRTFAAIECRPKTLRSPATK